MPVRHAPALAVALVVTGCFEDSAKVMENDTEPMVCTPGETQSCVCTSGASGSQTCVMDGALFGPCQCDGEDSTSGSTTGASTSDTTTTTTSDSADETDTGPVPQDGDTCQAPLPIPQLPFDDAGSTANFADRHAVVGDACNGVFLDFGFGAADVVYAFTPSRNLHYGFTAVPEGWDAAVYVLAECEQDAACVAGSDVYLATGAETTAPYLTAGQTYYVVVDGFQAPDAGPYTFRAEILGESCDAAIPLSLYPFTQPGGTEEAEDDHAYAATCPGVPAFGDSSPDVVYKLNMPDSATYRITLDADFEAGLYVLDSCQGGACLGASNDPGSGPEQVDVALQAETDYYLFVDGTTAGGMGGTYTLHVEAL